MAKYVVLYNSDQQARDLMAAASPQQMKASMDEWLNWRDHASKKVTVQFGLPL